jgi:uncharacterized membrane protein
MELVGHRTIPGVLHCAGHYGGRILQPTRVRAAQAIWIAFVLVQALDGVMTLVGIHTFGLGIEANPLIAWYAHALGPAIAVSGAKLFAVGCGIALYLTAHYRTIAALAITYVLAAVGPWIHLFWRADW